MTNDEAKAVAEKAAADLIPFPVPLECYTDHERQLHHLRLVELNNKRSSTRDIVLRHLAPFVEPQTVSQYQGKASPPTSSDIRIDPSLALGVAPPTEAETVRFFIPPEFPAGTYVAAHEVTNRDATIASLRDLVRDIHLALSGVLHDSSDGTNWKTLVGNIVEYHKQLNSKIVSLTREREEAREQVTKLERSLEAQVQLHARKADQKHEAVKRAELAEVDNASLRTRLEAAIDNARSALSALQCGNKDDNDGYQFQFMEEIETCLCNIIEPPALNPKEGT